MKIIDLLNKIANGDIPKRIKYNGYEWEYNESCENYIIQASSKTSMNWDYIVINCLNEEVEIIEEPQPTEEEINMYTNKFLEVWEPISKQFGKLFDEIIRIKNDLGLNLEDFIKEEPQEHKIPEKLELKDNWCRKKGDYIITDYEINPLILNKINEIIDYIEPKYTGSTYTIKCDED